MDAQGFARNAYKIFKKVLTITRNACIIKTVKDTTQTHGDMEVAIMEKLTADEFATKVMATGTELEVDELRTQSLQKYDQEWSEEEIPDDEQTVVLDIYAHINVHDGDVKTEDLSASDYMLTAEMQLTQQQADALYNGDPEIEQIERQIIMEEIYPQYEAFLESMQ